MSPATLVTVLPLALLAVCWLYWRWRNRRTLELAAALPGPPALPVLGNALIFMGKNGNFLQVVTRIVQQYGEHVKFWLGPELNIIVKNPHDIRLVLTSNKVNQKGPVYKSIEEFIGPGILSGGPTWRNHRKIVTPAYNKRSVQRFSEIFNREADNLVSDLKRKDPHVTINIFRDVLKTTTQCVCQTLMGLSKEESLNIRRLDEVVAFTDDMYGLIFAKMTQWWNWIPPLFHLLGGRKLQDYYCSAVTEMTEDIVQRRRRELQSKSISLEDLARDEQTYGIVDRYILCRELSDAEIIQETFTLFTTSQEASAKIASCVLLFLAHSTEWQDRVYKEILEVIGPEDRAVFEDDFKHLHQLHLVYMEALRYLPIAACIQRTATEEIQLERARVTIPAGTSVVIPIHALHRDPQYWHQPNRVRPERFLPDEANKRDPNAFVPFSLGAMDCLGRLYATAVIKTLVVRVIRHFQLEAEGQVEDLELDIAISTKFKRGCNVRVATRHKAV